MSASRRTTSRPRTTAGGLRARRPAPTTSARDFEAHLEGCERCRRGRRAPARRPPTRCRASAPPVAPPPELKERIMASSRPRPSCCRRPASAPTCPSRPAPAGCAALAGAVAAGAAARRSRSPRRPSLASALGVVAGRRARRRRRRHAHDRRAGRRRSAAPGASATLRGRRRRGDAARHGPAGPRPRPRLPGVAPARGATPRSRPTRCSASRTDGSASVSVPGDLSGVERRAGHRGAAGGQRRAERPMPVITSRRPERTLARPAASVPPPPMADVLPPPRSRDRRLLLELRPADLPGLHDADAGRHALPRVRAPAHEGAHAARRWASSRRSTYVLIADQRDRLRSARSLGSGPARPRRDGRLAGHRRRALRARDRRSQRRVLAAGHRAASCTPASSTSRFNMYLLYILGPDARAGDRARPLRDHLLRLAARRARSARCSSIPTCRTVGASGAVFGLMGARPWSRCARAASIRWQAGLGASDRAQPASSPSSSRASRSAATSAGLIGGALCALAAGRRSDERLRAAATLRPRWCCGSCCGALAVAGGGRSRPR